jgi:hypothetical protein
MAAGKGKTLAARTSFVCTVKGVEFIVRTGDRLPADHAVVKGREHLFEAAE